MPVEPRETNGGQGSSAIREASEDGAVVKVEDMMAPYMRSQTLSERAQRMWEKFQFGSDGRNTLYLVILTDHNYKTWTEQTKTLKSKQ